MGVQFKPDGETRKIEVQMVGGNCADERWHHDDTMIRCWFIDALQGDSIRGEQAIGFSNLNLKIALLDGP